MSEAGKEYNDKIAVDQNKGTELFEAPVQPGVDRSDTLHDFKQVSFSSLLSPLFFKYYMYICTDDFQQVL